MSLERYSSHFGWHHFRHDERTKRAHEQFNHNSAQIPPYTRRQQLRSTLSLSIRLCMLSLSLRAIWLDWITELVWKPLMNGFKLTRSDSSNASNTSTTNILIPSRLAIMCATSTCHSDWIIESVSRCSNPIRTIARAPSSIRKSFKELPPVSTRTWKKNWIQSIVMLSAQHSSFFFHSLNINLQRTRCSERLTRACLDSSLRSMCTASYFFHPPMMRTLCDVEASRRVVKVVLCRKLYFVCSEIQFFKSSQFPLCRAQTLLVFLSVWV